MPKAIQPFAPTEDLIVQVINPSSLSNALREIEIMMDEFTPKKADHDCPGSTLIDDTS
jgi:hypothetical protein